MSGLNLVRRPRRLRASAGVRSLVRETRLSADALVYPLFVVDGHGVRREISSMPGVFQLSVDEAVREAAAASADGVRAVILFGIPASKDETGSAAADPTAPVDKDRCFDDPRCVRAQHAFIVALLTRTVRRRHDHHRRLSLRVHLTRPLRSPRWRAHSQ